MTKSPGTQPAIFDAPWVRTAVLICHDLDFTDTSRELAAEIKWRVVLAPAALIGAAPNDSHGWRVHAGVEFRFFSARIGARPATSPRTTRGTQLAPADDSHIDAVGADLPLHSASARTL